MKTQETNILYKLDKNLSAFIGWHQAKFHYSFQSKEYTAEDSNTMQVGLVGIKEIAPKTNLFSEIGIGKNILNYEVGVSYQVTKEIDFDLFYRYKKVENLKDTIGGIENYQDDVTAKGFAYGITYKF